VIGRQREVDRDGPRAASRASSHAPASIASFVARPASTSTTGFVAADGANGEPSHPTNKR